MSSTADITTLLRRISQGEEQARDELYPLIEAPLRKLAGARLHGERPGNSLRLTALMDDAFLRLVNIRDMNWNDRGHFYALAAKSMRHIILSHWRAKNAIRRGGGAVHVDLEDADPYAPEREAILLALDEALERLEAKSPRAYKVVELKFFAGLNYTEIGRMIDRDPRTVKADWLSAKAWLYKELAAK